eukprot:NODE_1751_length_1418_cov_29.845873_g1580_i0.p1 GENE.NODE_1751_length_1418_cov_29.845873_g1580_i0~~NODE_1751_length_1418_cov_29.845873_g1580_i0.p1  ORF type:complete len:436 (-),score=72.11 NODE_1751_length_1418_cov_29.845873_g1580_i0:111-1298(-)
MEEVRLNIDDGGVADISGNFPGLSQRPVRRSGGGPGGGGSGNTLHTSRGVRPSGQTSPDPSMTWVIVMLGLIAVMMFTVLFVFIRAPNEKPLEPVFIPRDAMITEAWFDSLTPGQQSSLVARSLWAVMRFRFHTPHVGHARVPIGTTPHPLLEATGVEVLVELCQAVGEHLADVPAESTIVAYSDFALKVAFTMSLLPEVKGANHVYRSFPKTGVLEPETPLDLLGSLLVVIGAHPVQIAERHAAGRETIFLAPNHLTKEVVSVLAAILRLTPEKHIAAVRKSLRLVTIPLASSVQPLSSSELPELGLKHTEARADSQTQVEILTLLSAGTDVCVRDYPPSHWRPVASLRAGCPTCPESMEVCNWSLIFILAEVRHRYGLKIGLQDPEVTSNVEV